MKELTDLIRSARVEVQTRDLPACAAIIPWAPASCSAVRLRLEGQVAGYQDVAVRRPRMRDAGGQ